MAMTQTRRPDQRGQQTPREAPEFIEKVVQIDRVARVVKGGRRFRFRAAVVVGDGKGRVGIGVGKGKDVQSSIQKAVHAAKRSMVTVSLNGQTIHHEVNVNFGGAKVFLKPASKGTGVIAGGAVRAVVEAAGIHDILSKSLGSANKLNNIQAAYLALVQLSASSESKRAVVRSEKPKERGAIVKEKKIAKAESSHEIAQAEAEAEKEEIAEKEPTNEAA
jgi:small subunit ribosomal protein S5